MENLEKYKKALVITATLKPFECCRELRKLGIDPLEFVFFYKTFFVGETFSDEEYNLDNDDF